MKWKAKGGGFFKAYIKSHIFYHGGVRVQVLKVLNMHYMFSSSGDTQIPPR